jgi:ATP-dependent 26S proteasome regulatory subunit
MKSTKKSSIHYFQSNQFFREDYGEDFENDDEASASKSKESPAKKSQGDKKDATKTAEKTKEETSTKAAEVPKKEEIKEKPKVPTLDAETLERIDLEESIIELKQIAKAKRDIFLQFCEEKV